MTAADSAPAVLILAAGRGTRMKSSKSKLLHQIMGRPLIEYAINASLYLQPARLVLVTGFGAEELEAQLSSFMEELSLSRRGQNIPQPIFVRQEKQLGTGHAVAMARQALEDFTGPILIMNGDVPLISPSTLEGFWRAHQNLKAHISVLTVRLAEPGAYGRIVRDENQWLARIVEYRDATDEERAIEEINSGLYLVEAGELFKAIERLTPDNDQGEYYLTDVIADFRSRGLSAAAVEIPDYLAYEVSGVNDRYELAAAQAVLKDRINESWMRAGVTMLDPLSTYIESSVRLAQDVTVWPGAILSGRTQVGPGAEIGPFCHLRDCVVEAGARVEGHQSCTGTLFRADESLEARASDGALSETTGADKNHD